MNNDVEPMKEILRKLNERISDKASAVVTESTATPEFSAALSTKKTEQGVAVSHYEIVAEKRTVNEGLTKRFYNIRDNRTDEIVHDGLGLFESAMGIVKHLLYTHDENKAANLVELDAAYVGHMTETYGYKKRLTRLDESTTQHDVAAAKYSNSRQKLAKAKMQILKAL